MSLWIKIKELFGLVYTKGVLAKFNIRKYPSNPESAVEYEISYSVSPEDKCIVLSISPQPTKMILKDIAPRIETLIKAYLGKDKECVSKEDHNICRMHIDAMLDDIFETKKYTERHACRIRF